MPGKGWSLETGLTCVFQAVANIANSCSKGAPTQRLKTWRWSQICPPRHMICRRHSRAPASFQESRPASEGPVELPLRVVVEGTSPGGPPVGLPPVSARPLLRGLKPPAHPGPGEVTAPTGGTGRATLELCLLNSSEEEAAPSPEMTGGE